MVEFAMILPLLTVLMVGIFDFGLILREHQLLQNAAREGAHFSALPQNSGATSTIKSVIKTYLSQENITITDADITVDQAYSINLGDVTATGTKITVSYSRNMLIGSTPLWPFGQVTLTGQSVFRNLY